jgi:hypothetical protein
LSGAMEMQLIRILVWPRRSGATMAALARAFFCSDGLDTL